MKSANCSQFLCQICLNPWGKIVERFWVLDFDRSQKTITSINVVFFPFQTQLWQLSKDIFLNVSISMSTLTTLKTKFLQMFPFAFGMSTLLKPHAHLLKPFNKNNNSSLLLSSSQSRSKQSIKKNLKMCQDSLWSNSKIGQILFFKHDWRSTN